MLCMLFKESINSESNCRIKKEEVDLAHEKKNHCHKYPRGIEK